MAHAIKLTRVFNHYYRDMIAIIFTHVDLYIPFTIIC